jgi:hypothetical protein
MIFTRKIISKFKLHRQTDKKNYVGKNKVAAEREHHDAIWNSS